MNSPITTGQGKARTSYDYRQQYGMMVSYELPVGKGKRWLNRGGVLNAVFGGWTLAMSQNGVSGQPISIGSWRQPAPVPDHHAG